MFELPNNAVHRELVVMMSQGQKNSLYNSVLTSQVQTSLWYLSEYRGER